MACHNLGRLSKNILSKRCLALALASSQSQLLCRLLKISVFQNRLLSLVVLVQQLWQCSPEMMIVPPC